MASNRHLGRIVALQCLYEFGFRSELGDEVDIDKIIDRNIQKYKEDIDDEKFISDLIAGVIEQLEKLDNILRPLAPDWPLDQIARIDREILRMGLWELNMAQDAPPKVVINECVELAKEFGGENSSKFVNGVLGTAYREISGEKDLDQKGKKADG
jgi:N utilization substance protein B